MKKIKALIIAVVCLVIFSSCMGESSGEIFRCDIPSTVQNLDPQFTTDSTARMILGNIYEGLMVLSSDGQPEPGIAESYSVSDDNLTYTFKLRSDALWPDKTPVTAEDFVFAFRRMFDYNSPHMLKFQNIQGTGESEEAFGVTAQGDHTLVIKLAKEDPFFLQLLCDPAASPCNSKIFDESRGRYGLELDWVFGNGPFSLTRWDNTKYLLIRTSETYSSPKPVVAGGVNFYIDRDGTQQFIDGKTDFAALDYQYIDQLSSGQTQSQPVQKTVWCVVFNQKHSLWRNPLLRQGLAQTIDRVSMAEEAPTGFTPSGLFVPDAIYMGGKPFRDYGIKDTPLDFDTSSGSRLFSMGLASMDMDQLPSTASILVPDYVNGELGIATMQQNWQKYLAAYVNFEVAGIGQIQSRLRDGDYQMILMPMTPSDGSVWTILGAFHSESEQNYFGYSSPVFDELLEQAAIQPSAQSAAEKYAKAEATLLADAVIVPLYFETTYYATAKGVSNVVTSPFGDQIFFKYATKE